MALYLVTCEDEHRYVEADSMEHACEMFRRWWCAEDQIDGVRDFDSMPELEQCAFVTSDAVVRGAIGVDLIDTVRNCADRLAHLIDDDDIGAEKLEEASGNLLPRIVDRLRAALRRAEGRS